VVSLFFTICAIAGIGLAIALVVGFPLLLAAFGLASFDHPIIGYLRWPVMFFMDRVAACEMALDQCRQRLRRPHLACGVLAVLLVPRKFRQLQRYLRSARRGGRLDDVDVAFDHRGAGRRRIGNQNRPRFTET
jgi:hypothetical protein